MIKRRSLIWAELNKSTEEKKKKRSKEQCDNEKRERYNIAPVVWPEQVFLSWMFCVGVAWPYINTSSHAEAQHESGRQGKFPLSWKHCVSWWHCPRCDRRFLYNDRWNEKQPILILCQSAIIYEPCSPFSLSRIHFPSLCRCTHLRQTNLHVCLLFSQRNPNANDEKLFIVRRQLPPGVLVSQKALLMQWEISFLRFYVFLILKKRRQM